jgi:hypothetical protein
MTEDLGSTPQIPYGGIHKGSVGRGQSAHQRSSKGRVFVISVRSVVGQSAAGLRAVRRYPVEVFACQHASGGDGRNSERASARPGTLDDVAVFAPHPIDQSGGSKTSECFPSIAASTILAKLIGFVTGQHSVTGITWTPA